MSIDNPTAPTPKDQVAHPILQGREQLAPPIPYVKEYLQSLQQMHRLNRMRPPSIEDGHMVVEPMDRLKHSFSAYPEYNQPRIAAATGPVFDPNHLYEFKGIGAPAKAQDARPDTPGHATKLETDAKAVLTSKDKSIQEKLAAVEALHNAGIKEIKLKDTDSDKERAYRIENEALGHGKAMLHLFSKDDKDQQRIVLRAISDGKGHYRQERGDDGHRVSFEGTVWSQTMKGHSNLVSGAPDQPEREAPTPGQRRTREDVPKSAEEGRRHQRHERRRETNEGAVPPVPQDEQSSRTRQNRQGPVPEPTQREERPRPRTVPRETRQHGEPAPQPRQQSPEAAPLTQPRRNTEPGPWPAETDRIIESAPRTDSPAHGPIRQLSERRNFYLAQHDSFGCGATSLAMLIADQKKSGPPSWGQAQQLERSTGTLSHRDQYGRLDPMYPGGPDQMARDISRAGLHSKAYAYRVGDPQMMNDVDNELRQGHGVWARIQNPHTGHGHFIYVAGHDANGNYILGDPDAFNNRVHGHDRPITRQWLWHMMSARDGFAAGWA